MSDDSFIREVDEELRSDRFQEFWTKYGKVIIGLALAIVIATAGYRYWEFTNNAKSAAAGDAFMDAVQLADDGKHDEALAAFKALEGEGSPAYKSMALLRSAAERALKGDSEGAVKDYDAVIADTGANINMRSLARVRAGMLLVDSGSVADVQSRVSPLTGPGAPYRNSAREAIGLAFYKAGELDDAFKEFDLIAKDADITPAMRQRMRIMLDLIASHGGPISK
ncbi:MAG: tetratricopeptide repeat protein [Rhizobiaceae bacterium]